MSPNVHSFLRICLMHCLCAISTDYAASLFAQADLTNDVSHISLLDTYWMNTTGNYLTSAQKARMSNLTDILVDCSINQVKCDARNFEFVYHPFFYNCYRLNSGRDASGLPQSLVSILTSGSETGISLTLYAGLSDSQNYANNTLLKGFNVFVMNQSDYPLHYAMKPYKVDDLSFLFNLKFTFSSKI
jgi:hypothetical protein